jgi:hypothetical protein
LPQIVWRDGAVYKGGWRNGEMDGNGTYTWPDGSSYVGEWKGNQKDGLGTMTSAGGTVTHSGRWTNGKFVE